ncbi:hypothetical protein BCR36DRAFT_349554 [Piromyces finnis]|uniref:Uncharacterized protein n=1 Tax=Piromyces finnis TaxID=1754191 RepID=A0A1Y1VCK2_9FUNG|nr:hypothetical protein BCR36DRAFT_349554 [Piromyces finnis]|eukprot:ORX52915.1 hypothetical protein BCR36DRAFT_349554 [Piromyces finnis]
MDYMKYKDCCDNFSLDCFQRNNTVSDKQCCIQNNNYCNNNKYTQEKKDKILKINTNIQQKKKYIPKFTIGYRSDCKKCRDGVPNHYGHINYINYE